MATIYRRGQTWWGRFQYRNQELRKSLETKARSIALKRLTKWMADTKALPWGESVGRTYDEAMTSFLDNHCPTLKPNSRLRYEQSARFLTQSLSGKPLSEITSSVLATFETSRRENGAKPPTIRRDLACLSSMFTHVIVDLEWTDVNPVLPFLKRQKRRGRLKESPPKTRYLSVQEEQKLLKACRGKLLAESIAFAIDTGLRREEQWSLQWAQVDRRKKEITVLKEIAKGKRERRVPILPRAAQTLAQLPRSTKDGKAHIFVWANSLGERFIKRNKGLKEAAKRAGIPTLSWHDLRRTCGCRLLQNRGFSLEQVREWLGHESVQQTERAYAFLGVDALHSAVQKSAQSIGLQKRRTSRKPRKKRVSVVAEEGLEPPTPGL